MDNSSFWNITSWDAYSSYGHAALGDVQIQTHARLHHEALRIHLLKNTHPSTSSLRQGFAQGQASTKSRNQLS